MTVAQMYSKLCAQLTKAGCDSPAFDARCLLEDIGGVPRGRVLMCMQQELDEQTCERLQRAAERRSNREPLQYILQQWDFLGLTLEVGEGVLIPRADTEVLAQKAADFLQQTGGTELLDLCAGSGCVGLGAAWLCPQVRLTFAERYDAALHYLRRNVARYAPQARIVAADVLQAPPIKDIFDVITANPPYLDSAEMAALQPEVGFEPATALDGGQDGLIFYRAIVQHWLPLLKQGGMLACEVGYRQARAVQALFETAGLKTEILLDAGGIERVVCGYKEQI